MKRFKDLTYGDRLKKIEGIDADSIYVITGRLYNGNGWEAVCIETIETGDSLGNAIAITENSYKSFTCEPDLKRVIKNQIDKFEELASSENNEGREREEEKYLFAKECLEEVLNIAHQQTSKAVAEIQKLSSQRSVELEHAFRAGMYAGYGIDHENIHEEEDAAVKEFMQKINK